MTKDRYLYWIH